MAQVLGIEFGQGLAKGPTAITILVPCLRGIFIDYNSHHKSFAIKLQMNKAANSNCKSIALECKAGKAMPHLARTAAEQAKIEKSCVGPMIHEALDKGKPPTGL